MAEVVARALEEYSWFLPMAVVSIPYGLVIRYFMRDRDFWRAVAMRAVNVGEAAVGRTRDDDD